MRVSQFQSPSNQLSDIVLVFFIASMIVLILAKNNEPDNNDATTTRIRLVLNLLAALTTFTILQESVYFRHSVLHSFSPFNRRLNDSLVVVRTGQIVALFRLDESE